MNCPSPKLYQHIDITSGLYYNPESKLTTGELFMFQDLLQRLRKSRTVKILGLRTFIPETLDEKFESERMCEFNIEPYLKRFNHDNQTDFGAYQLRYNYGYGYSSKEGGVCLDTAYSFVLTKARLDIATIGFSIESEGDIFVKQIQGVPGEQVALKNLRWEKMLVAIVLDWAQANKFRRVLIQQAASNQYFTIDRTKKFHLRYNVTAERMGFVFNTSKRVYVRELA